MPLSPGFKLGTYEVVATLGAGGMGEVYRAKDSKLKREVALKVLPAEVANDRERLARFQREAEVLASLNHPNIAQIYGLEQSGETSALVMELVEGEDLAQRIARGAIPIDEALPMAKQIAEALEAAHEQGIVHRDLKPANIKVRPDGTVKVLDFGLAKALEQGSGVSAPRTAAVANSPTLTAPTQLGVILGTAAYMSPEQAKGRAVDRRADIWAFGAVLYEMLTGQRAFKGEDTSDTLAAVLRQDVDWTALPDGTPALVRRLLSRCLDRDPKRRLRDIGEARIVLEAPIDAEPRSGFSASGAPAVAPRRPMWRRAVPVALSIVATGATAAVVAWSFWPATLRPVTRFSLSVPEGQAFTNSNRQMIALSADGTQLVYSADGRLYLRNMSDSTVRSIEGTDGSPSSPMFSPDGRFVIFWAQQDRTLKRIAVTGGTAVTICKAESLLGMSWGPGGIVFGQGRNGILRVSADGGTPEVVVIVKPDEIAHGPQILPGGQHVLFTLATGISNEWDKAQIVVQSLQTAERKTLIDGGSDARYVRTGHLVYALSGNVLAVPFDARQLEKQGGPVPIIEGVRRAVSTPISQLTFSESGSLAYVAGPASASSFDIALTDRKGDAEPLKLPPGRYLVPRVSPDGRRIAFETDDGKEQVVQIYDLARTSSMRRLTFGGNNRLPIWSADGQRIAFQSDRDGDRAIFWQAADVSGAAERLTKPDAGTSHVPESWSPGGERFLFSVTKGTDVSLWTFSLRDRKATPFGDVHSSGPTSAVFSPDGRWVAYTSTVEGRTTTFVQPFPATGAKYQVPLSAASNNQTHPLWSRDGKELFYNPRPGGFEVVSVTTSPTFAFGNPVAIPRPFPAANPTQPRAYDIMPDGRFVAAVAAGPDATVTPRIEVVLNWFEELKQRVPTGR